MPSNAPPGPETGAADRIEAEVLARISPSPELLAQVLAATKALVRSAEEAARARSSPLVRALVAGSAARGTFLVDRLDLDLFLLFPPTLGRETLESEGLALAKALLTAPETRYAEHPYLRGRYQGFAVDAVPGYAIDDPAHPLSAVDRTPFHQRYLEARSTPRHVEQIRLTKQFLRSLGVYGSEARTAGFSGYLVELLILRFGSLRGLLSDARRWRIPVRLPTDPSARPKVPDDVALVLDDPVDPNRNVATALSRRNLALFVLAASAYLDGPDPRFFGRAEPERWSKARGLAEVARRGSRVHWLAIPRPALVDDILYPQLRKAERAIEAFAARAGFVVLGTASEAGEHDLLVLIETGTGELPGVQRRDGPPAGLDRSAAFLEKWTAPDASVLQGPYVGEEGTLLVESPRSARSLSELLDRELPTLPIGRDLRACLPPEAHLRSLEEAPESPELERALAALLGKRLPWARPRA